MFFFRRFLDPRQPLGTILDPKIKMERSGTKVQNKTRNLYAGGKNRCVWPPRATLRTITKGEAHASAADRRVFAPFLRFGVAGLHRHAHAMGRAPPPSYRPGSTGTSGCLPEAVKLSSGLPVLKLSSRVPVSNPYEESVFNPVNMDHILLTSNEE